MLKGIIKQADHSATSGAEDVNLFYAVRFEVLTTEPPRSSETSVNLYNTSSSFYMALQPISGPGLLFMRFRNLTLIDSW
jgi:hypothetical protein